jgi:EF-P beta-lysylation protein EpmB
MTILTRNSIPVGAGSTKQTPVLTWQSEFKMAVRNLGELCDLLELPAEFRAQIGAVKQFPVFVPPPYLARIRPGDPHDPLLLQVLPVVDEDQSPPNFRRDPLAESTVLLQPGLLHKYAGRALLVVTGRCAIHCRYCFRRHFPYANSPHSIDQWKPAFAQIAADPSINEVLLSGGDPLTLVDENLQRIISELESIEHVNRIRIHTRLPVVIPSRVTDACVNMLTSTRLQSVVVIHVNHAREIDSSVQAALARFAKSGIMVFNQSVLLRNVNDNLQALVDLSNRLIECNIVPCYLHQLDQVVGAAHFEVSIERGKQLIAEMRAALPGYAVPRYVQEVPGQPHKIVLA